MIFFCFILFTIFRNHWRFFFNFSLITCFSFVSSNGSLLNRVWNIFFIFDGEDFIKESKVEWFQVFLCDIIMNLSNCSLQWWIEVISNIVIGSPYKFMRDFSPLISHLILQLKKFIDFFFTLEFVFFMERFKWLDYISIVRMFYLHLNC